MNPDKKLNSDSTMSASQSFESVLNHVKTCNLNFQLQQSPFSAVISIKKSFVKDKSGIPLPSPPSQTIDSKLFLQLKLENQELQDKISRQEKEFNALKFNYEDAIDNSEKIHKINSELENEITNKREHLEKLLI